MSVKCVLFISLGPPGILQNTHKKGVRLVIIVCDLIPDFLLLSPFYLSLFLLFLLVSFFSPGSLVALVLFERGYASKIIGYTQHLSHHMGKPTICISENKGPDQLRSSCEADQRLCFRYSDSTIPLLLKSEISSF